MKLNLGSGDTKFTGFLNVDKVKFDHVDFVCNLDKLPYPFASSSIDEIKMFHCLEHLELEPLDTLQELYRILKPDSVLLLRLPYPAHPVAHNMWHKHTMQAKDFFALNKTSRHHHT